MGGSIGVSSTVGVGSEFWIKLAGSIKPELDNNHNIPAQLALQGRMNKLEKSAMHTLLYVEDNPANLMLVEQIISEHPQINLLSARDGLLGIELARTHLPDVILMDINLPGISGTETLKRLGKDPATLHIPVIAISANAMPTDIEKGLKAGFFRYLTKPIKVNEFVTALDEALKFAESKRDDTSVPLA
jgi:CheY-like chemotaxis protein